MPAQGMKVVAVVKAPKTSELPLLTRQPALLNFYGRDRFTFRVGPPSGLLHSNLTGRLTDVFGSVCIWWACSSYFASLLLLHSFRGQGSAPTCCA